MSDPVATLHANTRHLFKKRMLLVILSALGVAMLSMIVTVFVSRRKAEPAGLVSNRLAPCGPRPNCVCSEDLQRPIAPIAFIGEAEDAWEPIREALEQVGGKLHSIEKNYAWATFTTALGFVDDVELRLDPESKVFHIRSASRVGYSDLGANRKRVESIRKAFAEKLSSSSFNRRPN